MTDTSRKPQTGPPGIHKPKSEDAQARSAAALRANLQKRKAQVKARTAATTRKDEPAA